MTPTKKDPARGGVQRRRDCELLVEVAEVGDGAALHGSRGLRRGDATDGRGAGRRVGELLRGEDGVGVVEEVLEELLVLGAEVLAGLLEAVDLVELVLLLGDELSH